jgi:hypothetical protein
MTPLKLTVASTLIALAVGGGATSCPKYPATTGTGPAPAVTKAPAVAPSPNAPRLMEGGTDFRDMLTGLHVQCSSSGVVTFVSPDTAENRATAKSLCIESYNQDQQLQSGLNGIGGR